MSLFKKRKLLITGASGFLGFHLIRMAVNEFEVVGIYHKSKPTFHGVTFLKCDITDYIVLGNLIEDINPDLIIHTAAISNTTFCQENKVLSEQINVQATANLAGIASDFNIPFLFTSTDLVFDGKKGNYSETDFVNPLMIYGEQKAKAEELALEIYPNSLICRLPMLFGELFASPQNYLQQIVSNNLSSKTQQLFTDEFRSPASAWSISKTLLKFIGNEEGIFHLGGKEKISRVEFGKKVIEEFGLNRDFFEFVSQESLPNLAPRPKDVSLNSSKAYSKGFNPFLISEELKFLQKSKDLKQ